MRPQYRRRKRELLSLLAVSAILASVIATQSLADNKHKPADTKTSTPIKHLVIIYGENESFDHYFATYPVAKNTAAPLFYASDDTPAVNGLSGGLLTNNPNLFNPVRLGREDAFTCSLNHDYTAEQKAVNGGLLNKFVQATSRTGTGCATDGSTVMAYYDGNTVTALWNYAQHYAMNDNSFDTVFGPSTPGAINLISGQTGNGTISFLITHYPQPSRRGTKQEHTADSAGLNEWRATRCNFKRGSARPSLLFFTEPRISAARR